MYDLIFSKEAAKFIESLDKGYKRKMKEIVEALKEFFLSLHQDKGGAGSLQDQNRKIQDTLPGGDKNQQNCYNEDG